MNEKLVNLLQGETGDQVIAAKATIISIQCDTPDKVWEQVRRFPFTSGWLSLTDTIVPLYKAGDLAQVPGGIILSGELAGAAESLHIRQAESGWNLTRITSGDGETCLMIREEYTGIENNQQDLLQYEVYWKLDNDSYRPWVARLSGMVKGVAQ